MADLTTASADGSQTPVDPEQTVKLPGPGGEPAAPAPADPFELPRTAAADPFARPDTAPVAAPPAAGALPPVPPLPPTAPATGWTGVMPAIVPGQAPPQAPAPAGPDAPAHGIGGGLRGRILVIEGSYGGRRSWGRGGSAHAEMLSTVLAGVAPQILLSADAVDAVHLPGGAEPQTVLAHLRAAARHLGPVLIHLGGHLITDRRGGQLYLTLRDAKPSESLPWSALATELRHRPAELDTLVIADLSADHATWPQLLALGHGLAEGVPMWAAISPDPDQIGTFTRALVESLHRGQPGADTLLTPEQLQPQVHSVLRADNIVVVAHPAGRPYFRNTSRQIGAGTESAPAAEPRVPAPPAGPPSVAASTADGAVRTRVSPSWTPRGMVSLRKAGVPPTPPRPPRPVSLLKAGDTAAEPLAATAGLPAPGGAPGSGAAALPGADPAAAPGPSTPAADPLAATVDLAKPGSDPLAATVDLAKPRSSDPLAATLDLAPGRSEPTPDAAHGGSAPAHDSLPAPGAAPAHGQSASTQAPPGPSTPAADPLAATVDLAKPGSDPLAATVDLAKAPEAAPSTDYREAIGRIVRCADAGDHTTAAELALTLEQEAVAAHGDDAPAVLQARQVRAHVSRLAGSPALAAELYRQVAVVLLRTEGAGHPETQQAATNAEACWRAIPEAAEAIRIAPDIIELRAHLPGPDGRKLRAAERHLMQLAEAKARI
ncbi:hypothetical protein ACGFX4_02185 [Kitasatospora sp. NPDC048365]|uniref:hypothetical protein n=1 Tax=Kitasatospora sp. NPDC048365 TaxID=3364050 RepID=UPI0037249A35